MDSKYPSFDDRLHRVKQLSNGELTLQLRQLNQQKCVRDAELLLFLSELDERALYREAAVSSLFAFCVSRLGCSEEVAYKRVGAARLMRRFPLVFDLLSTGRIHLSALMLVKPHLTEENHREWLQAASGKSKRQVELLVAHRCPKPNVATSIRKLPEPRTPQGEAQSNHGTATPMAATPRTAAAVTPFAPQQLDEPHAAPATPPATAPLDELPAAALVDRISFLQREAREAPSTLESCGATADPARSCAKFPADAIHRTAVPNATPAVRIAPLSGSSYRVTFTANGDWKQKFDRARELCSHVIAPSDLPGLLERALDLLIEREERRRYGCGSKSRSTAKECRVSKNQAASQSRTASESRTLTESWTASESQAVNQDQAGTTQQPCQVPRIGTATPKDPGRLAESDASERTLRDETNGPLPRVKPRSRHVPAAVRWEIWQRDQGRCTFTDAQGNRCEERCFLEIEHLEPYALNGPTSVSNCTLRCHCHNKLTAEWIFGCRWIDSAIAQTRRQRRKPRLGV